MKQIVTLILLSIFLMHGASCNKKLEYPFSVEQAEKVNVPEGGVIIDRVGAEGPYKWIGGMTSNENVKAIFSVSVAGERIEREFEPKEGVYYNSVNFENENGGGYMLIYKHSKMEGEKGE